MSRLTSYGIIAFFLITAPGCGAPDVYTQDDYCADFTAQVQDEITAICDGLEDENEFCSADLVMPNQACDGYDYSIWVQAAGDCGENWPEHHSLDYWIDYALEAMIWCVE